MKHGLPITLLTTLLITGCNGGGSSSTSSDNSTSTEPQTSTAASIEHPGLYGGTYLNATTQEQGQHLLFITTDGQGYLMSDQGEVIVGTTSESESNIKMMGNFYDEGSDLWGASFNVDLTYNLGTLAGSYSIPSHKTEGTLSFVEYPDVLNRTIDLSTLDGTWVNDDEVLTISNGSITHTDSLDCNGTGTVSQIGTLNQFNVNMTFIGCLIDSNNGNYSGIMFLTDDTETGAENSNFTMLMIDSEKETVAIQGGERK